ncbi:MAG: pyridoxal 5'-phosphate synthase glutaminase subunit PdxT, partial [Propionibacteriaceae bacterium]|nr:pyridoxal 5'-phosphate synthase glutaminase subunit PdxT [Propionibacteriaceae bacterium]
MSAKPVVIGVLALQGAFAEHQASLSRLGAASIQVRQLTDLDGIDGLVIPGGESTVMGKLLDDLGMREELLARIQDGLPVLATCAGLILLSQRVENKALPKGTVPIGKAEPGPLPVLDVTTRRNAYGRQLGSFNTRGDFVSEEIEMVFIRAPYVEEVGPGVEVLSVTDDKITAVRQGNVLATAFHPELTDDLTVHGTFLKT